VKQLLGLVSFTTDGHTHAGSHGFAPDLHRGVQQGRQYPVSQGNGRLVLVPDRQHQELVSREPRNGVARSDHGGQPRRNFLEQLVTRLVSEGVVDALEPVDVDEVHGDATSGADRFR
jgi:hypothetical protein